MAPNLESLSDELLLMVLEEVNQTSPQSLLNVCLVSRQLCRLASSLIYRRVSIPSNKIQADDQNQAKEIKYTFEANLIAHTRHITVGESLKWSTFSHLLARMQHLETVTWHFWETPFPSSVKRVISKQLPGIRLHVEKLSIGHRTDDEDVQTADLNLLKSLVDIPNIHSVKIEINYEHPVSMRWLKDVLLSSKRLEVLHLTLPRNRDGRIYWGYDDLGTYDLGIEEGEQLESLTELVYESRCYYPMKIIPLSFFPWSKIRHLELRGHVLRHYASYLLTQDVYFETLVLEFIAGHLEEGDRIINELLSQVRGLEHLELVNPYEQLPIDIIALHGSTLKSLSNRFVRRSVDPYSFVLHTPPYTIPQLESLNVSCSHINYLALDIEFTNFMPYDILATLSRFPRLTHLRVYCRFADTSNYSTYRKKDIPHIHTDRLTVRHMFSYISEQKIEQNFEQLEVMFGDFPRSLAEIRRIPMDSERPNVLFVCHKNEECKVVVEDDVTDNEDPGWDRYFNMERLKTERGQTWPDNLEEILAAEKEAEEVLEGIYAPVEDVGRADMDRLFGDE